MFPMAVGPWDPRYIYLHMGVELRAAGSCLATGIGLEDGRVRLAGVVVRHATSLFFNSTGAPSASDL